MKKSMIPLLAVGLTSAYTTPKPNRVISRKAFFKTCAAAAFLQEVAKPAQAFDGTGSSAYAGKSTTSKAELRKSYQRRVIADVKDFKKLGGAIQNGATDGDLWVNFFIEYRRREPDDVGRTYAAFVDLVGNKELSGCGTLLAASFAKPGKPSEGLPSVKKYNAMAKMLDPIKFAGQKGDVGKAKSAYGKASDAVQSYLDAVELPSLSDPIYD
mmetsp:Transcript_3835/g.8625  ORF Transcript_3835/g.8625 Transcript_3835/m.8625 type:complete len:212 (+) Transcript_3835:52-687(+)